MKMTIFKKSALKVHLNFRFKIIFDIKIKYFERIKY